MRAVTVADLDGRKSLTIAEHEAPEGKPGEVIVAVKAVSLNNGEVRGSLAAPAGHRPGWDLAGVVEKAPAGSGFDVGDRVFGCSFEGNAWAEQVAVPARFLASIPDGVSFEAASALPIAGLSAVVALTKKPLSPGQRMLVTGATGGVGMLAIQLAAATGVHVSAFVRDRSAAEHLRALGARDVVTLEEAQQAEPYDLILDNVGGTLLGHALVWLKPRGVCVQLGDASGEKLTTFDAHRFRLRDGDAFGGTVLYGFFLIEEMTRPDPVAAPPLLRDLASRVAAGTLDPVINKVASWREVDAVARALLNREFIGKAVLRID